MKRTNWLWGLFFIGAAGAITANALGYLGDITLINLVVIILIIPVILKSIAHRSFAGVFFPLAFLGIIFANPLGIESLVPWPILLIALFSSIGFSLIFKKNHVDWHHHRFGEFRQTIEDNDDESEVTYNVSFGSGAKYVTSTKLRKVNIRVSFGAAQVYFDNAKLDPKGAEIYVDSSFSGVELFFPKEWNVEVSTDAFFGGVEEKNKRYHEKSGPKVVIKGRVSLSGIEITYI